MTNTYRSLLMIGLILAVSRSIHHLKNDDDYDDYDCDDDDDGNDDDDDDDDDPHQIVMRLYGVQQMIKPRTSTAT